MAAVGLPPVVLFWLSERTEPVAVTRANILAYSVFLIIVIGIAMSARGLFTTEVVSISVGAAAIARTRKVPFANPRGGHEEWQDDQPLHY